MRSLKEVKKELEAAKEKIEHFENYKEEWQSELSKSDDALELAKTELKNINDQFVKVHTLPHAKSAFATQLSWEAMYCYKTFKLTAMPSIAEFLNKTHCIALKLCC